VDADKGSPYQDIIENDNDIHLSDEEVSVLSEEPKTKKQRQVRPTSKVTSEHIIPDTATTDGKRSARSRIAPLQFWKNEKRVFTVSKRRESGTAISLQEQIIRVDDTPPSKKETKKKPKIRSRAKSTLESNGSSPSRSKSKANQPEDEGIDEEFEDWERVGKLVGMVKAYPHEEDNSEDEFEDEIATSSNGIEFASVFGSDYTFAKTLGKEFMGCGILEMKMGTSKKLKNSGKMQLVFLIVQGKVEAEVNELGFRIGQGGQFQVPRGNMYKISNPFKKTARIFFAQACDPRDLLRESA